MNVFLTEEEAEVLVECEYDDPPILGGADVVVASGLASRGLLMENPTCVGQFRVTEFGESVRERLLKDPVWGTKPRYEVKVPREEAQSMEVQTSAPDTDSRWEYKVLTGVKLTQAEKLLNKLGRDGWEVFYMDRREPYPTWVAFLKRRAR